METEFKSFKQAQEELERSVEKHLLNQQKQQKWSRASEGEGVVAIDVIMSDYMQPLVPVRVGGQRMLLLLDTTSSDSSVFLLGSPACPRRDEPALCYAFQVSDSLGICLNSAQQQGESEAAHKSFAPSCASTTCANITYNPRASEKLLDDSVKPAQRLFFLHRSLGPCNGVFIQEWYAEAVETVAVELSRSRNPVLHMEGTPIRLMRSFDVIPAGMRLSSAGKQQALYDTCGGLLGAGLPSSCRSSSLWAQIVEHLQAAVVSFDFDGGSHDGSNPRLVFSRQPMKSSIFPSLTWSEPTTSLDSSSAAAGQAFLMYHVSVCGINLLQAVSSNWLAVLVTPSPCLILPPFLFDRLMSRIPAHCPFKIGEPAHGQLCRPGAPRGPVDTLPALSFRLSESDAEDKLLPLGRLVVKDDGAEEQLCISRFDRIDHTIDPLQSPYAADMTHSFIGLGSLAMAAMEIAVDLRSHRVGVATRHPIRSTNEYCTASITCPSPMQTYLAASNTCLDPSCSKYMLMTLDDSTKTCVWAHGVSFLFVLALVVLACLDIFAHRLYRSAMQAARCPRPY